MHKIISIMAIAAVSSVATMWIAQNFSSCHELVDKVKKNVMAHYTRDCSHCSCCSGNCHTYVTPAQQSEE